MLINLGKLALRALNRFDINVLLFLRVIRLLLQFANGLAFLLDVHDENVTLTFQFFDFLLSLKNVALVVA